MTCITYLQSVDLKDNSSSGGIRIQVQHSSPVEKDRNMTCNGWIEAGSRTILEAEPRGVFPIMENRNCSSVPIQYCNSTSGVFDTDRCALIDIEETLTVGVLPSGLNFAELVQFNCTAESDDDGSGVTIVEDMPNDGFGVTQILAIVIPIALLLFAAAAAWIRVKSLRLTTQASGGNETSTERGRDMAQETSIQETRTTLEETPQEQDKDQHKEKIDAPSIQKVSEPPPERPPRPRATGESDIDEIISEEQKRVVVHGHSGSSPAYVSQGQSSEV